MFAATVLSTFFLTNDQAPTIVGAILCMGVIATHAVHVTRLWVGGDSDGRENPKAKPVSFGLVAGILAAGSGPIALSHWMEATREAQRQH